MRNFIAICFCGFIWTNILAQTKYNSTIENILVYQNAAEITHKTVVNFSSGSQEIIIQNVAHNLDLNTIQIGCENPITVLSSKHSVDFLNPNQPKTPEQKLLEDDLSIVKNKLRDLRLQKSIIESTNAALEANKNVGGSQTGIETGNFIRFLDYYQVKSTELRTAHVDLVEKEKTLVESENKLQAQINQLASKNNEKSGQIILQVISEKPQNNVSLVCSYITYSANWIPFYEIRAAGSEKPLQIIYKAKLTQSSGIDWQKVKISLSSGTPNVSNNIPSMNPWFLGYYTAGFEAAYDGVGYQAMKNGEQKAYPAGGKVLAQQANDGVSDNIQITQNTLNTQFDIDLPYNIPSNGLPYLVTLKSSLIKADFRHLSIPKMDPKTYLTAEIVDWAGLNLLPGEANIVSDGNFVGKTYIQPQLATDTLVLTLGNDKQTLVKREKLSEYCSTKLFGIYKKEQTMFEYTVRNNRKDKISLTVKDQIPLSTDKEIEVEIEEQGKGILNQETGIITWNIELGPSETKKFKFGYKIKFPKDKILSK